MPIDLYYMPTSNQCQAIQMVASALGIELNLIFVNLQAKEQLAAAFVALNPQHTIPTLNDNGFVLWETRAILIYLVEKYGKAELRSLYPSGDVQQTAIINQRLYFDMGTLYRAFGDCFFLTGGKTTPELLQKVNNAFGHLDHFLAGPDQFAAGRQLTVADFALIPTTGLFEAVGFDFSGYRNVSAWYERMRRTIPGAGIQAAGLEMTKVLVAAQKAKLQAGN